MYMYKNKCMKLHYVYQSAKVYVVSFEMRHTAMRKIPDLCWK